MDLDPRIVKMLDVAREQYTARHPDLLDRFTNLIAALNSSPGHIAALNQALQGGYLRAIDYFPPDTANNASGRSGFDFQTYSEVGKDTLSGIVEISGKDGIRSSSGTLHLGDDVFEALEGVDSEDAELESGEGTALTIITHEAGHGRAGLYVRDQLISVVNNMLTFIGAQAPGSPINITSFVQQYVSVKMRDEGLSNLMAYNAWAETQIAAATVAAAVEAASGR